MPQPFPRHLKNPQFSIGDALQLRPELFARGMAAISQHTQADSVLNTAMIHLLGADPEPALIMLTAIKNNNIKQAAYLEVASERLDEADLKIFEGVLTAFGAADKERNRLAHDLWAVEPQLPDSVALISSREFSKICAKIHLHRNADHVANEDAEELIVMMRASGLVYNRDDFARIQKQMSEAFFLAAALSIMLDGTSPDHEVDRQRQQLQDVLQKHQ